MVNGDISHGNIFFYFIMAGNFWASSGCTGTVFCRNFIHIILSSVI